MKNRSTDEFKCVYRDMYSTLKSKGYSPKLHKIDNETSKEVEKFIAEQHTKLQYAPPHIHRQNAAERGIQTWKYHFIAGLVSINPEFPIRLWCRLIE